MRCVVCLLRTRGSLAVLFLRAGSRKGGGGQGGVREGSHGNAQGREARHALENHKSLLPRGVIVVVVWCAVLREPCFVPRGKNKLEENEIRKREKKRKNKNINVFPSL